MLKLVFSLLIILATTTFADVGYIIENYKVNVQINEQNNYNVNENIKVKFTQPRRGIYRIIPLKFNGRRIGITDIRTNVPTNISNEGNYIALRLGDPNQYLTGLKDYIIKYRYNIGWDRNPDYDEVYYNLVGNDWDTTIKKVEFTIELPNKFDSSKINFTLGPYGSTNTKGVTWSVEGNTIKGYTTVVLAASESLTIALPLPEGYFDVGRNKMLFYLLKGLLLFIYILVPGIAILIYNKYKDRGQVVQTVEFYPPDDLTPSEIGYYIDGRIDAKDITSLIFYWANKGYLKINELNKGGIFSKEEFEIEFQKPLETEKDFEKNLYNALLAYRNSENKVNIKSLKDKFYKNISKTAEILEIDLIMNQKNLYSSKSTRIGRNVKASVLFIIIAFFGYFFIISTHFGATSAFDILLPLELGIISFIITKTIGGKIKIRTEYGRNILGRIQGFKRFLETAEKRKLETLLEENPSYFYNILPYTIVLGVSSVWADKFKELVTEPPQWYGGSRAGDSFALGVFMGSFNNSLNTLNRSMMSQPQAPSNYGGGLSSRGGGSSGGGAGGGGGRSW